ncbi:MAG: radical SAM protein, partial [Lachnospiraceae bacterium]|nr:radical SAM protein [Lachnospiraceae bacterium]
MREVSLYIHIPFCVRKCLYCDFLSAPGTEEMKARYVARLCKEIRSYAGHSLGNVKSVFFGGGTPTCLRPTQIEEVLSAVREVFSLQPGAEMTVECNPGTVTAENLHFLRSIGIDRLSIGTQSAVDRELQILGRIHTFAQAKETYLAAREAGFENISMDLMSALPGQTIESFRHSLNEVIALAPEHVSVYSLIIEEGTPFFEKYGADDAERQRSGNRAGMLISEEEEREMVHLTG